MNSEHYRNAYERHEKEEIPEMSKEMRYLGSEVTSGSERERSKHGSR
jgi:hypothetical protein